MDTTEEIKKRWADGVGPCQLISIYGYRAVRAALEPRKTEKRARLRLKRRDDREDE